MEAKSEKEFIAKDYTKVKGSSLLKKSLVLEKIFIALFDLLCSFIRKKYQSEVPNKKILILSMHRLGDSVFSIPAIQEIINYYEGYKIYIICYPETLPIFKIKFLNVNLKTISKNEFLFGRRIATKSAKKLVKDLNPSKIIDLTGSPLSAFLIWNINSREKIGTNIRYFKNVYTSFTPIRETPHFIDIYLDVVKLIKPATKNSAIFLFQRKKDTNNKKILIHPFAILNVKQWSLRKFIELAARLGKEYPVEIICPPGFIAEDVRKDNSFNNLNFTVTENVENLIEKVSECFLYIANDSGPTYIAGMLGKPTFTIYGPTNPQFSLPMGEHHNFYQNQLRCSATTKKVCFTRGGIDCPSNECMNSITVDDVETTIKKFLNEQINYQ